MLIRLVNLKLGGVFLPAKEYENKFALRPVLSGLKAWAMLSLTLLLISSFVVSFFSVKSENIGYISSAITFISAAAAGWSSARAKKENNFFTGIIISFFIV